MNVCVYHNADLDGYASGAIWKTAHENELIEMVGLNYGQDVPWELLAGNDVTLLDFCIQPFSDFVRLLQMAHSVTWIDHHKSAIETWDQNKNELPNGCCSVITSLDVLKGACELAWEFYCPHKAIPRGVFLLGEYDCWRHCDPDAMPYQMGMRLHDMDPVGDEAMGRWGRVFALSDPALSLSKPFRFHIETMQAGKTILAYQSQQNAKLAKAIWFPVEFDGKRWMAVNQGGINSQFWDAVWDASFDGKLGFVRSRKHWTVSLYSETVDCSEIAKRYGGGGHPGAAGYQCQNLPFTCNASGNDKQCVDMGVKSKWM